MRVCGEHQRLVAGRQRSDVRTRRDIEDRRPVVGDRIPAAEVIRSGPGAADGVRRDFGSEVLRRVEARACRVAERSCGS